MTIDITLTQYQANLLLLAIEANASVDYTCPDKVADALKLYDDILDKGLVDRGGGVGLTVGQR